MNASLKPQTQRSEARKLYDCLQGLHFLHRLKMEELEMLLAAMKKRSVPAGATVYKQGDKADAFFLISSGRLGVWQRSGFKTRKVAALGEEQYFGDNSLLSDTRHSSSVVAETNCELYVLYKNDFERILLGNHEIAAAIKAHIALIKGGGQG
jgi:CRP-like cAMP-binding protein